MKTIDDYLISREQAVALNGGETLRASQDTPAGSDPARVARSSSSGPEIQALRVHPLPTKPSKGLSFRLRLTLLQKRQPMTTAQLQEIRFRMDCLAYANATRPRS